MYKYHHLYTLGLLAFFSIASNGAPLFREHSLSLSGSIGYSTFEDPKNQSLIISNFVTDLLSNTYQKHQPSFAIAAKQQLNLEPSNIHKLMFGPALYFQKLHYSGEIWELMLPEFYNYQFDYTSNNVNLLLEADLYFNPMIANKIIPFLSAGLGLGVANIRYDDYALPGIPVDSERHRHDSTIKGIFNVGAGFAVPVSPHWSVNLRYAYMHMGKIHSHPDALKPISLTLNSQTVFIGVNYSIT